MSIFFTRTDLCIKSWSGDMPLLLKYSRSRPKAKREEPKRDEKGRFSSVERRGAKKAKPVKRKKTGTSVKKSLPPKLSKKAVIAKANAVRTGSSIQRWAVANEIQLAEKIGGTWIPGNKPVDVEIRVKGKLRGIELKTADETKNRKLTIKGRASELKKNWEKERGGLVDVVVYDDKEVKNANGPGKHDFRKRKIYYRRGWGSFRIDTMYQVKNESELKRLLGISDKRLPLKALGRERYNQIHGKGDK